MAKYKPIYEKYNLKVQSCHVFTRNLEETSNNSNSNSSIATISSKIKKLHDDFGITYFVIAGNSETTIEGCLSYSKKLIQLSLHLSSIQTDHTIHLLLHNGKDESVAKIEGKSAFEFLLDCCGDNIEAQVDVGWLFYGQEDVESFLWRNKKRILSLHYKDFERKSDNSLDEAVVGCGLVDVESCFQFARANEVSQIVDIDKCSEKFYENMKSIREMFGQLSQTRKNTSSFLSVYDIETCEVKILHKYDRIIEAPNWLNDGKTLIYNSEGKIYRYSIPDDKEEIIPTDFCNNCNNDHVPSPDNKELAISHSDPGTWLSKIYIVPINGGIPKIITQNALSFLHGWSPDGKELSYCAFRKDDDKNESNYSVDIFTISTNGGDERRLTKNAMFNDGPEYQPDGSHIWFNSTRSGLMQIWRMERDGKNQTQITFENQNNWFAHISPDGKKVVNLAYSKDGLDANEHLPNMNVSLWMMNIDGKERKKIIDLFGGQGSINVNSWAPDSKKFAFVSYELNHK